MLLEYAKNPLKESECGRETRDDLPKHFRVFDFCFKVGMDELDGEEMLSVIGEQRLNVLDPVVEQAFVLPDEPPQHPSAFHHDLLFEPQIALEVVGCLFFVKISREVIFMHPIVLLLAR